MFINPSDIVNSLPIHPGMVVADIGAGSGAFSIPFAKIVGTSGKVYAIDVQRELLSRIQKDAQSIGLRNISILWGNAEQHNGTHLREKSIDVVLISNVLFQIEHKENFAKEILRILRPTGFVVLIDWTESFGNLGPKPDHVFSEKQAKELFESSGFTYSQKISSGAHHYGIIFKHG
jgi:ubiquinone/menaquinone biosynthesis C-methylase UbiE